MPTFIKPLLSLATALSLTGLSCPAAAAESAGPAWPTAVVKFEDLRPLTHFKLQVPGLVAKGRVTGPAILQAHINAEGTVAKTALLASCGNPDLDEASLHAMRAMQFQPYTLDGAPIEVTLVVPIHVPARLGRSPR
ncbi:energy transducer TonB [Rhodoferax sp. U11-2br]|uniref:energy transducer TonB n=1 Tax=Rhodoferax sp. U11-2br TaxID=2838878 RepID=UPI001BE8C33A|nr:energy transducer TonB [Rhodoferax sp. U11-2br]MBT3068315.1 energy transducer TonB [Rhodoferax sp. U11-2br]